VKLHQITSDSLDKKLSDLDDPSPLKIATVLASKTTVYYVTHNSKVALILNMCTKTNYPKH